MFTLLWTYWKHRVGCILWYVNYIFRKLLLVKQCDTNTDHRTRSTIGVKIGVCISEMSVLFSALKIEVKCPFCWLTWRLTWYCSDPRLLQGEDPLADSVLTFMAQTSALTYAPGPGADYPGGRLLRTPGRLPPDELSPKVDGNVNRQKLVAALGTYAARKPPVLHGEGDPWPRNPLHTPWKTPRVLSAPADPRKWPSPPGDSKASPATGDGKLT